MLNNKKRYGQFYTENNKLLLEKYNNIFIDIYKKQNVLVDPFVGQGHLIEYYLSFFDKKVQKKLFEKNMIKGFDIDKNNIEYLINKYSKKLNINKKFLQNCFQVRDSFLEKDLTDNTFILTNPPYLAKNVIKKEFKNDYNKYKDLLDKHQNYFDIALNLYAKYNGIWIIPSNFFFSNLYKKTLKLLFDKLEKIYIYDTKTFNDTGISITTFYINNNNTEKKNNLILNIGDEKLILNKNLKINEIEEIFNTKKELKLTKGLLREEIEKNKGNYKVLVINENYKEEVIYVNEKLYNKINNNILISRNLDTGSKTGKIGLYTIKELWNSEAKTLITKVSSRAYIPLFFEDLNIKKQLKLKELYNKKINQLRNKYYDLFLTNFKNVTSYQRKRITFKEMEGLINYLYKNYLKK